MEGDGTKKGQLTNSTNGVSNIRKGSKSDFKTTTAEGAYKIGGKPLHDDIVGPIHAEMRRVNSPQRPVTKKVAPSHRTIQLNRFKVLKVKYESTRASQISAARKGTVG